MEYIKLNNGVEMPVLGLGTFKSVGYECKNAVSFALQNGFRLAEKNANRR